MRLGRVFVNLSYIVDLDNEEMVSEAKDCIDDDICNSIKYDGFCSLIKVEPAPEANESDIPSFLKDEEEV